MFYFAEYMEVVITAMVVNRFMVWLEKKVRVPGFVAAGTGGGH